MAGYKYLQPDEEWKNKLVELSQNLHSRRLAGGEQGVQLRDNKVTIFIDPRKAHSVEGMTDLCQTLKRIFVDGKKSPYKICLYFQEVDLGDREGIKQLSDVLKIVDELEFDSCNFGTLDGILTLAEHLKREGTTVKQLAITNLAFGDLATVANESHCSGCRQEIEGTGFYYFFPSVLLCSNCYTADNEPVKYGILRTLVYQDVLGDCVEEFLKTGIYIQSCDKEQRDEYNKKLCASALSALFECFLSEHCTITHFILDQCPFGDSTAFNGLRSSSLISPIRLKSLIIYNCNFTIEELIGFARSFGHSENRIKKFTMDWCSVETECEVEQRPVPWDEFFEWISKSNVQCLEFSLMFFTAKAFQAMAKHLPNCASLTNLILDNCNQEFANVLDKIPTWYTLRELTLTELNLTQPMLEQILTVWKKSSGLLDVIIHQKGIDRNYYFEIEQIRGKFGSKWGKITVFMLVVTSLDRFQQMSQKSPLCMLPPDVIHVLFTSYLPPENRRRYNLAENCFDDDDDLFSCC